MGKWYSHPFGGVRIVIPVDSNDRTADVIPQAQQLPGGTQCFRFPPNAVIEPWIPNNCSFSSATDWQERQCDDIANWALVLQTMASYLGLTSDRVGMLMPATTSAAGSYNDWDIQLLAQQVEENNIRHVGTWAIAYDHTIDYAFAKTIASLMDKSGNLYVSSNGDCGDKQPCYGSIQDAINDAATGSVMLS